MAKKSWNYYAGGGSSVPPPVARALTIWLDRDVLANRALAIQFDYGLGQGEPK